MSLLFTVRTYFLFTVKNILTFFAVLNLIPFLSL